MGVQCFSAICSKDSIELLPLHLCGESIQHICVDYLYAFNWFLSSERKMVERKTSTISTPLGSHLEIFPGISRQNQPLLSPLWFCFSVCSSLPALALKTVSVEAPSAFFLFVIFITAEWVDNQISDDTSDLWLTVDDKSESFMRGIPVGLRKRPSFL